MSGQLPYVEFVEKPQQTEERKVVLVRRNGQYIPYKIKEVQKFPTLKREEVIEESKPVQRRRLFITPTRGEEVSVNENYSVNYSPTFVEAIRQRVKYVFAPLFSDSNYQEIDTKVKYKLRVAYKKKTVYKPKDFYKYLEDNDYEPHVTQIAVEDFAPKDKNILSYNPSVVQESYPTFTYATFGLPDTFIDQYAPEESIKIKPVTDFEIRAKPRPLIVSQAHLVLLDKLMKEVFRNA